MVHDLSGGEKARLLLTKLAMQHNNFLMLDEPTNHLDIDSREVLEKALNQFDGTILFVSHDRYFINKIATAVVELSRKGTTLYLGNYDYYVDKKDEQEAIKQHAAEKNAANNPEPKTVVTTDKKNYEINKQVQKEHRKLAREVDALETKLDQLTKSKDSIETEMTKPDVFNDLGKLQDLQKQLDSINAQIKETESSWEEQSLKLEDNE